MVQTLVTHASVEPRCNGSNGRVRRKCPTRVEERGLRDQTCRCHTKLPETSFAESEIESRLKRDWKVSFYTNAI